MNRINYSLVFMTLFVALRLAAEYSLVKNDSSLITPEQNGTYIEKRTKKEQGPVLALTDSLRQKIASAVRTQIHSPYRELILGMFLGIDELDKITGFKDRLKTVGLIHVVVVSGFNISLVAQTIFKLVGSRYELKNVLAAELLLLLYALLTGFEPPVVRALIMASVLMLGKYYGRKVSMLEVLLFSALVMLAVNPIYIESLSFQLSFLCTLGLVCFSGPLQARLIKLSFLFKEDLITTLAAQSLVWPLISYHFGNVSFISPLVNALVLWTVPLATILSSVFIILTLLQFPLLQVVGLIVYIPLRIFTYVVDYFSKVSFANVTFKISLPILAGYYGILLFFLIREKIGQRGV